MKDLITEDTGTSNLRDIRGGMALRGVLSSEF
jgi:hypothetical protein